MPPRDYRTSTTGYYDRYAAEFCENTFTVDVSALYTPFLREIPEGGAILDAGCGSGRDSLAFLRKGYRVVSIDASREMVAAATKHTGQQALLLRFDEIDFTGEFDGIWACGSLVHVARPDLHSVFTRFSRALKPNGVIYLSFKYGDTERMEGDRFFNDMNEATLGLFLGGRAGLELVHLWITEDLRNYARGYQNVLNAWYAGMQFQKAQAKRPPMLLASVNVGGLDAGLTSHRRRAPATPPRSDPSSGSQNQRPALDRNR